MSQEIADKLVGIAADIRVDIKQARADGDNERRNYLRGELQGILQALDLVVATGA